MTIVYVPVDAVNKERDRQQMRMSIRLFEEGWSSQGILDLKDSWGQIVRVMVFFKEEG